MKCLTTANCCSGWFYAILLVLFGTTLSDLRSAEPDSTSVASAIEELVTKSVAIGEQSVVSIACINKGAQQPSVAIRFPFGLARQQLDPTSPEFVPRSFGAGVIVSESGLILTALHVLGDVDDTSYFVWHKQRPLPASIVATSPWYDLAVIKVDATKLTPVQFGDAATVDKGRFVVALGNPMAIARDGNVSAAFGVISNVERRAPSTPSRSNDPLGRETLHHYGTLLQTDANVDAGFDGGALLNLDGKMIGLLTSYTSSDRDSKIAGFAIPVNEDFHRVVDTLKRGHTPAFGFLGIGPETLSESLRSRGHHGIRAVSVIGGTPADQAGLQANDIITHINDEPIYDESHLFWRIGILYPDSTARLKVVRGDLSDPDASRLELPVVLTKKFVNTVRQPVVTGEFQYWRGMRVDYATASPEFSRMAQRPRADSLYIADVESGSAAWKAELRAGQFVTHVGDVQVTTPADFAREVSKIEGDVKLEVTTDGTDSVQRTVSP